MGDGVAGVLVDPAQDPPFRLGDGGWQRGELGGVGRRGGGLEVVGLEPDRGWCGALRDGMAEMAYRRFMNYRDLNLFTRCTYESTFEFAYPQMAEHYHLLFDQAPARVSGPSKHS